MGIILKNVNFSYSENKVLDEIDMIANTGEHIGIIGASGGGKSTFLKLLSGLYTPSSGYIEVEGECNPLLIRRNVAVVMQNHVLLPASIKDNITCGHQIDETIIRRACESAMLTEWINTLPEGIHTFVGERESKVSGGQAQRISIARAIAKIISLEISKTTSLEIAKQVPVILLDEPTSALDNGTSDAVLQALKSLTHGKTLIHITHKPEALIDCNKIYRLEGGKLHVT